MQDLTLPSDDLKAWNGHLPLHPSDLLKPYKYSVSCSLLPEHKAPVRVKLKSGISSLLISDYSNPPRPFSQYIILSCLFFYHSRLFPFNHYPSGRSAPDSIKLLSLVFLSLFVLLPQILWTCWKLLHLSNPLFLMCYKLCTKLSFCLSSPPPSKFSLHFFFLPWLVCLSRYFGSGLSFFRGFFLPSPSLCVCSPSPVCVVCPHFRAPC